MEIQKHVLRGHFPFHADLPVSLALHNFLIWKNQESEFAIGLRSLVFSGHFQIIMQWRYTPIQKRLLEALSGEADVGRPLKIDKSSQGQSPQVAEGAVRKIKGKVQLLYCVLH